MRPRELYEKHVPEGVRDLVSTTATGALIGAGTALAGKIFQRLGTLPSSPEVPPSPGGGYAQREQARRSSHYHGHKSRY